MNQKWDAERVLEKWVERNSYSPLKNTLSTNLAPIYYYKETEDIPIFELESAVIKAAKIVNQLGSDYLDIFRRAEKELENARQNMSDLERVKQLALSDIQSHLYLKSDLVHPKSFLLKAWAIAVSRQDILMPH
ncbi:hypothetical protein Q4Q35_10895 [Flavivirga aquimarina]|uniref:DUF3322 domain-containing protein n=1 Tax=Flavivirga aquimarina TaxID=2027862 RepID=A0ABT8WB80_9FLAO|nr:hypothetical protein [Flavivirga aquimarina]MDO5970313.1 hypothetical protein [Flavivirga aquimarina]